MSAKAMPTTALPATTRSSSAPSAPSPIVASSRATTSVSASGPETKVRPASSMSTVASRSERPKPPRLCGTRSENAPSSANPAHSARSNPPGSAARTRAGLLFSFKKRANVSRIIS